MRRGATTGLAIMLLYASHEAHAANLQAQSINDAYDFLGDRVSFATDITEGVTQVGADGKPVPVCIPAAKTLKGIGSSGAISSNDLIVKFRVGSFLDYLTPAPKVSANCQKMQVEDGTVVDVPKGVLDENTFNRYGMAYGTLVVPFKWEMTGKKDILGSASVGPYLGYRFDANVAGFSLTPVVFVAASNISLATSGANSSVQSSFGVSYGVGLLGSVKNQFNLGLVAGFDRVNSSANFKYNNRLWLALELGFSFSQ